MPGLKSATINIKVKTDTGGILEYDFKAGGNRVCRDADKALCDAGRELARLAAVAGVQDKFMASVVAANEAVEKWRKEQPK